MISVAEYMMGRDVTHALECTPAILHSAMITVDVASRFLILAKGAGVAITCLPDGSIVTSGWRPPSINARTEGASPTSLHMVGDAVDLHDPEGTLDAWARNGGQKVLQDLGLWLESPLDTPRWCHIQTRPPPSGQRIFRSRR